MKIYFIIQWTFVGLEVFYYTKTIQEVLRVEQINEKQELYKSLLHIDTGASDLLFHISEKSSKTCTEEEKQKTKETVDLFFEELLRFNYALQKPAWEDISTLSEDLKDAVRFQEKYILST